MLKILAVDDDLYVLEMYKSIFCEPDFDLKVAEDASTALTVFQEFKPDLFILDAVMPAGGGEKVFNRIRKLFMLKIPIIFYTGSPEAVAQFSIEPRVIIIKKPADPYAILEEAKKLLET